jgi:hypothetical protein
LLFNVLAMVAKFEADLIRSRTKEGMRVAKAKGHLRGKRPKLKPREEAHLVELLRSGEYTTGELGDLFDVARSTVYRAVARAKHAATATTAPVSTAGGAAGAIAPLTPLTGSATYRPRHHAPNDLPSENRARRRTAARRGTRASNETLTRTTARREQTAQSAASRRKRFGYRAQSARSIRWSA